VKYLIGIPGASIDLQELPTKGVWHEVESAETRVIAELLSRGAPAEGWVRRLVSGLPRRSVAGGMARRRLAPTHARIELAFLRALWQIYDFLFKVPRACPTRDADLFFSTDVPSNLVAVDLLDILDRPRRNVLMASALTGSAVVVAAWLAWIGLPRRS
jgi:hypothetical protein